VSHSVRMCSKCISHMTRFGTALCQPGPGKTCLACRTGKKVCSFDDELFATHPELRAALRRWVNFCNEGATDRAKLIVTEGTYGQNEAKRNSGKYPVFTPAFHALRAQFENLLQLAIDSRVPGALRTLDAQTRAAPATPHRRGRQEDPSSPSQGMIVAPRLVGWVRGTTRG
jgi:hypothetical protein